jgi:hypothetical protein
MKKGICSLILLVAVLLCVVLWVTKKSPHPVHERRPPVELASNAPVEAPIPSGTTVVSIATRQFKPWQRPAGVSDGSWAYALRLRDVLLHANRPLDFYARVVDQNGQPVPDVQVEFRITRIDEERVASQAFLYMKEGSEQSVQTNIVSCDSNGWIRFTGIRGKELVVCGIVKGGYISDYPNPSYVGTSYDYNGQKNPSGDILATNAWNPAKGYIFHMWKKGETQRLVPVTINVNLDVKNHGGWVSNYFVSFVPPRVEWTNFSGTELMIHGIRRLTGDPNRPFEFTFTMAVPNGGILFSTDAYPYRAPITGYETSWSFENKPQNYPPDFPWAKNAYVKLRGGAVYAGLQVGFCNNTGFNFSFTGYLNPSGSQNLEPDPEKLITDPEEIRRIDEQTRVK